MTGLYNKVLIKGRVLSEPRPDHEIFGEMFYTLSVSVERTSGACDVLPVTMSDRLADPSTLFPGDRVEIKGQLRSYSSHQQGQNRLFFTVFARELTAVPDDYGEDVNTVEMEGRLIRNVTYRTTPLGREISDIPLSVLRTYGRSDYIPCIAWGRNARYAGTFTPGQTIRVAGRVQSRSYIKQTGEGRGEERTTYEVSVSRLEAAPADEGEENNT